MSEKQKRGPYVKKGSRDYINNKEFTGKLVEYARYFNKVKAEISSIPGNENFKRKQLKELTLAATTMPESLAKDIMTLARRLTSKYSFSSKSPL